ncbi:MAG: GNAT family N-acetyltransferase [Beijerinckiaceae bacterium]
MIQPLMSHDVHLHYFLRPDHWDVADLWAPHWGPHLPPLAFQDRHDWLFEHIENLHEAGSTTICAVNARTGGVAGFVTFEPESRRLHQIVVASSARGSGAAKMLLDEAKRLSPSGLIVEFDSANGRALRFFEREGFKAVKQDGAAIQMMWGG